MFILIPLGTLIDLTPTRWLQPATKSGQNGQTACNKRLKKNPLCTVVLVNPAR